MIKKLFGALFFCILMTTSIWAGQNDWQLAYNFSPQESSGIYSMGVYNDVLYIGVGTKLYTFNGSTWQKKADYPGYYYIWDMIEYQNKFYVATTGGNNQSIIYVYDGNTWQVTYTINERRATQFAVYNNKLYLSTYYNGYIIVFDGYTWKKLYDLPEPWIFSFDVYQQKLYAGTANQGRLYSFDGTNWIISATLPTWQLVAVKSYNDFLYIGSGYTRSTGGGRIYKYNPLINPTPQMVLDTNLDCITDFIVYDGKLYASGDSASQTGKVLSYDGSSWQTDFIPTLGQKSAGSFAICKGKLYVASNSVVYVRSIPNNPPSADAGEDVTIYTKDINDTILLGTAADPDQNNMTYRWLEGSSVLLNWTPVTGGGMAQLNLSTISTLGIGVHTLTLEVSDGQYTASSNMVLTINNTPPVVVAAGNQTVQISTPIFLNADISDYDGDPLSYLWREGSTILYSGGSVNPPAGGNPIHLPTYMISGGLPLGIHTIEVEVSDGINLPEKSSTVVEVIDTIAPTLSPIPDISILWPPNHEMRLVLIQANVSDNSGSAVLSASISCNDSEAQAGIDYSILNVSQSTGEISVELRSERLGKSEGRIYTISITAQDQAGNSSTADVNIVVPHDQRKK